MALSDRIPDRDIYRIYVTIFTLGLAYGVALSLIAIFLDERGFDSLSLGSLATWFALGLAIFSLPVGVLIRRFSARRVLLTALLGYAVSVGIFPFLHSYAALGTARFFDGAFSVAVWVSSETLLLDRSKPDQRAFTTSLYAISLAVGYVVGPLLARVLVTVLPLSAGFWVAGAASLLAALYVFLRLGRDPQPSAVRAHEGVELNVAGNSTSINGASSYADVLWRIKTSCFATFAYGYFQASVVLFLPLFLIKERGIEKEQTIIIPAFFAAGMLVFSNVAGRLGDRYGHLALMRVLSVLGATMIGSFVVLGSFWVMCASVFIAGASLASISPVSLALQGVVCEGKDLTRATSLYNTFYALGMLIGPPVSGALFAWRGGAPMLLHFVGLWLCFTGFTLVFRADDPRAQPQSALGM